MKHTQTEGLIYKVTDPYSSKPNFNKWDNHGWRNCQDWSEGCPQRERDLGTQRKDTLEGLRQSADVLLHSSVPGQLPSSRDQQLPAASSGFLGDPVATKLAGHMLWSPGQEGPWERNWQPTSVFLPGKARGQRMLKGTVHGVPKSQTRLSHQTTSTTTVTSLVE